MPLSSGKYKIINFATRRAIGAQDDPNGSVRPPRAEETVRTMHQLLEEDDKAYLEITVSNSEIASESEPRDCTLTCLNEDSTLLFIDGTTGREGVHGSKLVVWTLRQPDQAVCKWKIQDVSEVYGVYTLKCESQKQELFAYTRRRPQPIPPTSTDEPRDFNAGGCMILGTGEEAFALGSQPYWKFQSTMI